MTFEEILKGARFGETTVLDISGGADARKITVEARKLLPEEPRAPKRSESPAKKHVFHAAESLATYLVKYGSSKTVIFADTAGETIYAVVDETAKDGFELLTMKPQIHPLWKPWADLAGKQTGLEAFAAFVAQNRRTVIAPDGRELVLLFSQVRGVQKTTIERGRGKKAVNGVRVEVEIQGQRKDESVELPETITLDVPLYVGTSRKQVELDLCLELDETDVVVVVTAGTIAEARVAAFEDMVGILLKALSEKDIPVILGKPDHAAWKYLEEPAPSPVLAEVTRASEIVSAARVRV